MHGDKEKNKEKNQGHASVVTVRSHLPSIFVFSVPQSIFILFFISSPESLFHSVIPTAVTSFCCIYRRRCYGVVAAQSTSESCSTPWDCTNSDESDLFKTLFTRRVVQNINNTPVRQLFKRKPLGLVQYCLRLLSVEKKTSKSTTASLQLPPRNRQDVLPILLQVRLRLYPPRRRCGLLCQTRHILHWGAPASPPTGGLQLPPTRRLVIMIVFR